MKRITRLLALLLVNLILLPLFTGCNDVTTTTTELPYNENNPGEIYYETTPEENIEQTSSGQKYANNEVLVVAAEGTSKSAMENLAESYQAEVVGYIEVTGDYQWKLNETYTYEELNALVDRLGQEELVEDASLQTIQELETSDAVYYFPNDEEWENDWNANDDYSFYVKGDNWGVEAIGAPFAWKYTEYMTPVRVGLIDNMFNTDHEDLKDCFAEVFNNLGNITDSHGTHVAGTIAAEYNNGVGITGVYPFGVNEDGSGNLYAASYGDGSLFTMKAELANLIVRNVKVINLSIQYASTLKVFLAAKGYDDVQNDIISDAEVIGDFLEKFLEKGYDFVITQAAGNYENRHFSQTGSDSDPNHGWEEVSLLGESNLYGMADWGSFGNAIENEAVRDRIIVVGSAKYENHLIASDNYSIADSSNTGSRVDVMAPGVDIESCVLGNEYGMKSGTSMAAPHVAGAAATLWSFAPNLSGARVAQILKDTSTTEVEGTDVGMIDLQKAMIEAGDERTGENPFASQNGVITTHVVDNAVTNTGTISYLAGATINAVNPETGEVADTATTDSTGSFTLIVSAGTYNLEVSFNGYDTAIVEGITVRNGEVQRPDEIRLSPVVTDFTVPTDMVITLGEIDVIEPEVIPSGANGYTIQWSSSDESVATVSPTGEVGIITTLAKGTTTITAELTSGGQTITKTTNLRVASQARDTVLVLDISSSMDGEPLDEMKKAAVQFCQNLLGDEYNNRVGLVFYNTQLITEPLTDDLDAIISRIESIRSSGRTDMEAGLSAANSMLQSQGAADSIKNVVIMADGLPNEGKTSNSGSMPNSGMYNLYGARYANAVIDTAQEMMANYNLYSLGFFHSLSGTDLTYARTLMQQLTNQTDGYYQVDQAENLQFAFGDISEEINVGSKIVINIACPVDVTVSYGGEKLSSSSSEYCDAASFGTLQLLGKNRDIKVVSLDSDKEYDVKLVGTGQGQMDYSVNYFDDSEKLADYRSFEAVPITQTTVITSNTNNTTQNVSLNIDEDGDGEIDTIWTAMAKSKGEITYQKELPEPEQVATVVTTPTEEIPVWLIVAIGVFAFVLIGSIVVTIVLVNKKSYAPAMTEGTVPVRLKDSESSNDMPEYQSAVDSQNEKNEQTTEEKARTSGVIQITNGSMDGFTVPIQDGETLILGKDPRIANIVFSSDYKHVSRLHCSVTFDAKTNMYYVVDFSSNGTYFTNKKRLEKEKRTPVNLNTVLVLANDECTILLR